MSQVGGGLAAQNNASSQQLSDSENTPANKSLKLFNSPRQRSPKQNIPNVPRINIHNRHTEEAENLNYSSQTLVFSFLHPHEGINEAEWLSGLSQVIERLTNNIPNDDIVGFEIGNFYSLNDKFH